ncbi:MAG TPA: glycosyltransferase family 2 protein [Candidatus Omnitrophota bacterium]|nr:glycosyltransferase family 2 protein [Candidatus Omnitrophota bacterium]HPS19541.1 glycosyltransferase family 2 protein [Candidatus Omnitrophota bacterium]
MKLVIQIPCHNEENTLPVTLRDLPKKIEGVDVIETLIINDGSTDGTVDTAKSNGANHILNMPSKRGLAEAFKKGLSRAVELGADIIVNTDGDNQYKGEDIPLLVRPIIEKRAEIVVGCRDISAIQHFSFMKKMLQKFGSHMVRKFSNTDIPDTTSGFRAYSREAAMQLNVFSEYTYTLETIIQAGRKGIPITHAQIRTNPKLRESRLIKSIPAYIGKSVATMLRVYLMYEPLKFFTRVGGFLLALGAITGVRYAYFFFFAAKKGGHVQSLILGSILCIIGFLVIVIGLLGDIIAANRKLNEETLYRIRKFGGQAK